MNAWAAYLGASPSAGPLESGHRHRFLASSALVEPQLQPALPQGMDPPGVWECANQFQEQHLASASRPKLPESMSTTKLQRSQARPNDCGVERAWRLRDARLHCGTDGQPAHCVSTMWEHGSCGCWECWQRERRGLEVDRTAVAGSCPGSWCETGELEESKVGLARGTELLSGRRELPRLKMV